METNGTIQTPTRDLTIRWNPDTQLCDVAFNPAEYKTFDMILGILEMAKIQVTHQRAMAIAGQMQMMAQAAHQEQNVLRQLRK